MEKIHYKVIGLMSGTSLDGLDMAYCHFFRQSENWGFELIKCKSISYSLEWEKKLKNAIHNSPEKLLELTTDYGRYLGLQTKIFIEEHSLNVDFIASHGHTVFHQPEKGFTLQIGAGQELAIEANTKVISDFRKKDISFGGQGAPLVPIGDKYLFGQYTACLNLGGIANVSFEIKGKRVAFDIGLANMLLNHLANKLGQAYDVSGNIAASGSVDSNLLEQLNELSYFNLTYPKSLGYEWFLSDVLPIINASNISTEDKLTTAVEHEAIQIGKVLSEEITEEGSVLITGGGAFNTYLIERIKFHTASKLKIIIPDAKAIDFKEAIIFAFMGVLHKRGEANCLSSVTGARMDVIGGEVFYPY